MKVAEKNSQVKKEEKKDWIESLIEQRLRRSSQKSYLLSRKETKGQKS